MTEKLHSILVVDDEKDIVDSLYDTFVDRFEVHKANSAKEAMAILKDNDIDLIISDQRMPEMTGTELFAEIEKECPNMGKILLTGFSDLSAVVNAINQGAVDKYISKPWGEDQIISIVLEVLNARFKQVIAQKKEIESQLVQTAKMASLGEMVAGIAHEINNPLSFIHANLGNLSKFSKKVIGLIERYDQVNMPPEARSEMEKSKEEIKFDYLKSRMTEMIERSMAGSDRMKKIIEDLKTFSRLDATEFAEADINEAIETTLNIIFHEYKNRITVKKEFGALPPVECFIAKLNQVFMNLLVNACHSIEDKGEIGIKTSTQNGTVKIEISDSGSGIPDDVKDKIFETFFTTKPVGKGTGLGLSISQGIVKQHKGEIAVNSKVGEGTTFSIKIPLGLKAEDLED